jgi:hypothetical protein
MKNDNVTSFWINSTHFTLPTSPYCERSVHLDSPEIANSISALFIVFLGFTATTVWNTRHKHLAVHLCYKLITVNGISSVLNHWTGYLGWRLLDQLTTQLMAFVAATSLFESMLYQWGLVLADRHSRSLSSRETEDDEAKEDVEANDEYEYENSNDMVISVETLPEQPTQRDLYDNRPSIPNAIHRPTAASPIPSLSSASFTSSSSTLRSGQCNKKPKYTSITTQNSSQLPLSSRICFLLSSIISTFLWFIYLFGLSAGIGDDTMAGLTAVMAIVGLLLSLHTIYRSYLASHPQGKIVKCASYLGCAFLGLGVVLWGTYERVLCPKNPEVWSKVPIHALWHFCATYGMYLMLQAIVVLDGPRCNVSVEVIWPMNESDKTLEACGVGKSKGPRSWLDMLRTWLQMFAFAVEWSH